MPSIQTTLRALAFAAGLFALTFGGHSPDPKRPPASPACPPALAAEVAQRAIPKP